MVLLRQIVTIQYNISTNIHSILSYIFLIFFLYIKTYIHVHVDAIWKLITISVQSNRCVTRF